MARGLANARPPGSAKLANAPPPGLTRRANAPQLPGGGGGAGRRWNWLMHNDVDFWWFINESNELRKLINKALFRTPVLVCWLRRRIMRPMLCSIYTNIFEFHQQRSWSTIIYWLSKRKNATYHAIEYQLSKKVLYSWSVVCTMHYFCALFLCVGSYIKGRQLNFSHYLCQGCVTVV